MPEHEPHASEPHAELLIERFELHERLGQGAFGVTWAATERASGRAVVVKRLALRGQPDWKRFEQFEREARVLRALDHPAIPRFVDAFELEGGDACIVYERAPGETLAARIERGDRWTEPDARALLVGLLQTLAYLHSLSPRVIHRDIKPGNIVIGPDGHAMLVDFGAVRDLAGRQADGGMTVVGTAGYMPPEQAMGRADARSDLFALAATMVHALTHAHPSELIGDDLRLSFRDRTGIDAPFAKVLARMLEPDPGRRFATAKDVLAALSPEMTAIARRGRDRTAPTLTDGPRTMSPAVSAKLSGTRVFGWRGPTLGIAGVSLALVVAVATGNFVLAAALLVIGVSLGVVVARKQRARARELYVGGHTTRGRIMSAEGGSGYHNIRYVYDVDGQSYSGSVSTYDALVVGALPDRPALVVFYDPARPQDHTALFELELAALEAADD